MDRDKNIILIIGCGYMANVYFTHFSFLKEKCLMVYRNKKSNNYIKTADKFGDKFLISQEEAINLKPKLVLSCVSPESHFHVIEPFISKTELIAVEKPPSLNLDLIEKYSSINHIKVLMNRRYYYWVSDLRSKAIHSLIRKIIVNIPEQFSEEDWHGIPKSIPLNSIHVFDLIYYICNDLNIPKFSRIKNKLGSIITDSLYVDEIIFQINFDAIERFSINFYLKDNSVIECCPIENAYLAKEFNIEEPTKEEFIRKYIPSKNNIKSPKNKMPYQKPGILELCQDLLISIDDGKLDRIALPDLSETYKIMNWIKNSLSKE